MNSQDFSDSSDESDFDYKPPGEEEILSEIDSDDQIEDDDNNSANTSAVNSKKTSLKRIKRKRGPQKKLKQTEINEETVEKTKEEVNNLLNSSEEDKKRLDALWEEFQRPITKKSTSNTPNTNKSKSTLKEPIKFSVKPEITKKRNFEQLFDNSVSSNKIINNDDSTAEEKSAEPIKVGTPIIKKAPGGLANVLSQIGKKNKLTVLEKSKQDWDGYKQKEGIVEELVTYNKGKHGFLEKRDFLERTDLRQFELEKSMRAANRSHRN